MFSKKKLRNELNFIRQKLTCDVINANVRAYELLLNKEDDLGTSFRKIQAKLYKDVKLSLKAVDVQTTRSNKLLIKLEDLHKYQEERRCQASRWLNTYLSEKEKEEERLFKQKHCNGIDVYSLTSLFNYDDIVDEVEETEDIEEEIVETEDLGEKALRENTPADKEEAGEHAEVDFEEENSEEVLSTLLAKKEKIEIKKGRSKNETEQKIQTKTDREA